MASIFDKPGGSKGIAPKKEEKKKGFLGINLPAIGIAGHNLVDLPSIGVTTDKHNPITQVSNLVTGFPGGLLRAGIGLGEEGRKIVGGQANPLSKKEAPLTQSLITSPVKTLKTLNPADIPKIAQGDFGKTALGKRVKEEGVLGTGLSTATDLSLLAGGVGALGKLGGAGALTKAAKLEEVAGATSRAAGLGKTADAGKLAEAATKAAGLGDVGKATDLQKAAEQVNEATKIRAEKTTLPAKITEKAVKVSKLGAEFGNVPAKPYELLGKGLSKIPGGLGAASEYLASKEGTVGKAGGLGERF